MDKQPVVSVIIPNYNHAQYLEKRLESIFNQTFQNFEVILLDDVSTDGSIAVFNKYVDNPKVSHFVINEENSGSPFKQWNKGIALAKGEFIWIAESDDYCEDNFLLALLEILRNNSEMALAYSQSYRVNSFGEIKGTWLNHTSEFNSKIFEDDFVMDGNTFIENFLIHKNVIPNVSGVLFRNSSLSTILPLKIEPYLRYNADWFYYIQLLSNFRVGFVAEPLNYFRFHSNSVIANAGPESGWMKIFKMELRGRREMMRYIEKVNPSNLKKIHEQKRIGDNKLYFLTAQGFINQGNISKALLLMLRRPTIIKRMNHSLLWGKFSSKCKRIKKLIK